MQRTKAPFRADEVGSLLRPPRIKEARARLEKGEITAEDLRKAEDLEIEKVVHKQASIGLKLATDGEFRRSWWHFDFLAKLTGCELFHPETGIQFAGVETRHDAVRVIGKLDFPDNHPMLDHFRFLKKHADAAHVTAKMTIPSPAVLHFRGGRKAISKEVYPDLEEFYLDLGKTYRKAVKAFYDAGCRYLQFDDTVWAYLCSQEELQKARERGDNPDGLQEIYARVINYALAERPADMVVTTHVCRGNFRSTWISSGGYEPVAETMLAGTNYDGYFLEYDSDRAGGFEPLRYLPKGNKVVVVGVITSKFGELEKKDDIKRRLEEAAKFAPLDQLAVSPQCGFASTEEGNILSEEEQWAKLSLAVEVANEVWGKSVKFGARALDHSLRQIDLAQQRRVRPRHLLALGRRDHFGADPRQHLLHFEPRRADMARQRRRERAVGAFAVERHLSGRGCKCDQRSRTQRRAGAERGRRGQPRAGFDVTGWTCGSQLRRHRIVAAGIEDQDVGADLIVEAGHDRIHVHHRVGHAAAGPKLDIDRRQVIAAVDLHAVTGVVDHRHLRPRGIAQEVADRHLHRRAIEVGAFGHYEADVAQAFCHRARIIGRIGQRPDTRIGAVADHQRDAPYAFSGGLRALALLRCGGRGWARCARRRSWRGFARCRPWHGGCRSRRGR